MERIILNKHQQAEPFVRPITMGGTGATDPQSAIENLGGIHTSEIGTANGIAPLDANNLIPIEYFPNILSANESNIDGPTVVYTSSAVNGVGYTITNYDNETEYTISTNKGSLESLRTNGGFMFYPPTTPGITVITVNGKNFPIQVLTPYADTPLIELPTNASDLPQSSIGLRSTDPVTIVHGFEDPTVNIQWQFATDVAFTNITTDVMVGYFEWEFNSPVSGSLYARVRYQVLEVDDRGYNVMTPWSPVVSFNALPTIGPSVLLQVINDHIDTNEAILFKDGNISADGTLLSIMRTNLIDSTSTWFIYQKGPLAPHDYESVFELSLPSEWLIDDFSSINFASDNQRFFLNCRLDHNQPNIGNSLSRILVYKTTVDGVYTDWTLEQTIELDLSAFGTGLLNANGVSFALSDDMLTLAVGIIDMTVSGNSFETGNLTSPSQANGVIIFSRDGTGIYQQTQTIVDPYPDASEGSFPSDFGVDLSLSHDGSRLAIIAPGVRTFVGSIPDQTQRGAIAIYELDVDTYIKVYEYIPTMSNNGLSGINYNFTMAKNADVIALAGWDINDYQVIIILEKISNIWTETQFFPPGWNDANSIIQGEADSIVINANGTFIAIGSPYSSFTGSNQGWDNTGYVCYYNKLGNTWTYSGIIGLSTPEASQAKFGNQLALADDNTLYVFDIEYDRWTTYDSDYNEIPAYGAVLIYK